MDKTVTMSLKGLLLTVVVLLALLTAYLLGGAGQPEASATRADDKDGSPAPHTMTMVGSGTATAVPDQLSFTLSVSVLDPDLSTALGEGSTTMKQVLVGLKQHGVSAKDMQSTGLSMNPEFDYPNYGPPVLKGYRVVQKARITVPQLTRGGKAIAAAVRAGGNRVRVSNIGLEISDKNAVWAQARASAVAEATRKAQEYAEAAGQDLGDVVTLQEIALRTPQARGLPMQESYRDLASARAAVPIRAGEDELNVRVQVVWELR